MSVSSVETFRQLMIFPLPDNDTELNSIADNQLKYLLKRKRRKSELFKANREINKEAAEQWLKKRTGKPRPYELTAEEQQSFYKWFTSTIETFKSDDGLIQTRELFQHLLSISVFEDKSQLTSFVKTLDLKKKNKIKKKVQGSILITFPEFSYALNGCGMKNISQFREFIFSQQKKKDTHHRHSHKLPLHMTSVMSSMASSLPYRKEQSVQMKRTTTKLPLAGGGVMYMCCPDGDGYAAARPNTAPVGGPLQLIRQRASKSLLVPNHSNSTLLSSPSSNLLSSVLPPPSPVSRSRRRMLLSRHNGSGRPEIDD